jgi:hypothetical protein
VSLRAEGAGQARSMLICRVWCQWCLGMLISISLTERKPSTQDAIRIQADTSGHTSHSELVSFLQRSKASLRDESSLIIVKENTCEDGPNGSPKEFLDEEDSSLTR